MESAGAGTPASGGPAIPAPALAASGADPTQETSSSGSGNVTRPCSDRQQDGEAQPGASKFTSLNSLSRDSDRQQDGNASSSSKKRKRMTSRSYIQKFKMDQGGNAARKRMSSRSYIQKFKMDQEENAADVLVDSPDIVGKENTSSGHVADSNIYNLCEASRLIGKNKRQSSDALSEVSKRLALGLHELSETVVKQCSTPFSEAGPMFSIACTSLSDPLQQLNGTQQKEGVKKMMNTPENLHAQLKQELSKLIKVLQLPDNVRFMAEQLFEYVLNNHQVVTEPVGILHAFNIALCWRAASLLNCKVDRRELLALADKSLNCECNEDLVALMYRKLRTLKEKIPYRAGETSIKGQPVSVEDIRFSSQETSTNLENDNIFQNKEMDLHGKFTNGASQEISTVAEQIISERQQPVQETHRGCHVQNDEIPSMIVEKSIDLVGNVFSLREKNILCKQQLEISGLVTHRQNNVIRLKEVCSLVLEHIRRSHIDEMTRREKIKQTARWFTMLMYAFLEHMKLQHEKLELLQSGTWSSERQLKENLHQVAKSGQLDLDFDQHIALPDSNFVMEEFIHFKEQIDEYRIVETSLPHCRQSSNAALLTEITLVRNEVLSEPISTQAMENEPVETSVGPRGGLASDAVDFSENIISCSSDVIGVQSAACSSSTVPSNDDSIGQCWRVASLLNCKVDQRESLALADKSLNCECNEDHVELMYRNLRTLKEKIPYRAGETSIKGQPVSVEDIRLSWQETPTNLENDNMFQKKEVDLNGKFTSGASQEISTIAEQIISERQQPVQETHRECHVQNDEIPSMIVEKSIDLVGNVFSIREKNILCKQQLEISGLVTHRQNNVIRLKEVCSLVLEHIRRSHIDEMTRRENMKLTAQWFNMFMYAFLEHMKLQHEKLEGLQSDTWSSERQLKENLHHVAKSGQLDLDFDQRIALPDSNFVMEEFIHFKEQIDEYRIAESSLSHCRQSSNAALLMEITLVRNEVLSEPISIQAMENEPVETSVGSRGGLASDAVVFSENIISCSSDGIGVQSASCSSSAVPSNDDSIGQEASTSECRNTEHIKIDAKPSTLLGGATSLVRGVNSRNNDTIDTDGNHLESPILASSQSFISLVGAQSVLPCMSPQQSTDLSAQQNVAPSRCPPVEAEHTGLLDMATQAVHDLQPEMQPSILLPDAPVQKMPDDRSQTGVQPDRATGLPSKRLPSAPVPDILGTEPACDLQSSLGEVHDEPAEEQSCIMCAIASRNLQPETQSSTSTQSAPFERTHSFVMPVLQSLTVHHTLEPSLDPHARAESTHALGSLTGHVLQPEVQSLASMKDRLAEAEGAVMLGSTAAEDLQPRKNDLHTFMHCQSLLSKDHEHKKALLEIECNQEIAKVKKKYASLLQKEDSHYLQNQRDLTDIYGNFFGHNSLAEGFQGEITLSAAAQGSPVMEQPSESCSAAEPSSTWNAQPESTCDVPTLFRTGNVSRLNWILGRREKAGPRKKNTDNLGVMDSHSLEIPSATALCEDLIDDIEDHGLSGTDQLDMGLIAAGIPKQKKDKKIRVSTRRSARIEKLRNEESYLE